MAVAEELKIVLRAETAAAVRALRKAQKETNSVEGAAKKMIGTLARSVGAWAGVALSIRGVYRNMQQSVQAFQAQERAEAGLNSALRATGQEVDLASSRIRQLAGELQQFTVYGDEAGIEAATLMTQLGKMSEVGIKQALPATADLASALGMDLNTAASLVSRSIGTSTNALSRYGIEIDNSLEGTERFDAIIGQINDKFGGFAADLAQTSSGSLLQFNNAMGDMREIGGEMIMNFLQPATIALTNYVTRINDTIRAKQTLNELEGVQTEAALEQQLAARRTLRDESNRLYNQQLANVRVIEGEIQKLGEVGVEIHGHSLVIANQELKVRHDSLAQSRLEVQALQQRLQALRDANAERGDYTVPMGPLLPSTAAATAAAEGAGGVAAQGYARGWRDQFREEWMRIVEDDWKAQLAEVDDVSEDSAEKIANNWQGAFQTIAGSAMQTFAMLNQLSQQNAQSRIADIQRELDMMQRQHEQTLAWAEVDGATEQELSQMRAEMLEARAAAEDKAEKKKKEIAKTQFRRDQALNIAQTAMNTATGIMQAFAQLGAFAGPVAAMIGAMGAVQTGIITQQKVPAYARGGEFTTSGPQLMMVGDNPGGRERVRIDPQPDNRSGGGNVTNIIHVHAVAGSDKETIAVWVAEGIRRGQERGLIGAIA